MQRSVGRHTDTCQGLYQVTRDILVQCEVWKNLWMYYCMPRILDEDMIKYFPEIITKPKDLEKQEKKKRERN